MTPQEQATAMLADDQRRRPRKAYTVTPTLGDQIEAIGKLGLAHDFARIFGGKA